jgi:acyl-CoA thioesterase FadM
MALLAAEGYLVVVAVGRKDGKKVEVPAALVEALNPYLASEP